MELRDTIGKITLDYSHYSGEDLYCDGAVEDDMLKIARDYSKVEYQGIIEERANWPIMYHFSSQRANIIDWLPVDKNAKVLEVGSGCGAITGTLSRKAGQVTCVELSKKRSLINAYRNQDCDNVTIRVGNFTDIEPELDCDYDYCFLIGVFEYGRSYIDSDTPYEDFLRIIRKHTKGIIVIAIENRFGMKYWAGCKEDHLSRYFAGLEGYRPEDGVQTFSKQGLKRIFEKCGEYTCSFYYPYPDYKFMNTLFSDRRMPKTGELCINMRNYDGDRIKLFDEKAVYDGLIEDGEFDKFSNSFLVLLGGTCDTAYARFSNDRAEEYQIVTEYLENDNGKMIKKRALSENGKHHLQQMYENSTLLSKRYKKSDLAICPAKLTEDGMAVVFPFIEGRQLSEIMDEKLASDDMEGFEKLFDEYVRRIDAGNDEQVADFDLVFSNIIVNDNTWTVIDYEWVERKQIPTKELAFRALYCYILEDDKRNKINHDLIIKKLDITVDEEQGYREREALFQKEVTGRHKSMAELRDIVGGKVLSLDKCFADGSAAENKRRIKIYIDTGSGFNEGQAYYIEDKYNDDEYADINLDIPSGAVKVRIDPCEDYAVSYICDMSFNGKAIDIKDNKRVYINGKKLKDNDKSGITAVFFNEDPNIVVEVSDIVRSTGNNMNVKMKTSLLKKEMIDNLAGNLKRMIRL